jgi:hypothetical protein
MIHIRLGAHVKGEGGELGRDDGGEAVGEG